MQNTLRYSYIFTFTLFVTFVTVFFAATPRVEAAAFSFRTSTAVVHQGQEVHVDILLDPEGETINTVSVTGTLPEHLVFGGFDDSASIVSFFVDDPKVTSSGNQFTFSGIIPGGFSGLIDPFAPSVRKPGTLMRLIFTGKTPGVGRSDLVGVEAYLNDGEGMRAKVVTGSLNLLVDGLLDWLPIADIPDTTPPLPFTPVVTRDFLLFQNDYVLIFNTKDKESGINHYQVKEGSGVWTRAVSPYVLTDQTLSEDVWVKAVDRAGNERIEVVRARARTPANMRTVGVIVGVAILLAFIIMLIRRHRQSGR